jgi:single-strand DNA-binding protein
MYNNGATVTLAGRVAKEPSFMLVGNKPKATIRVAWSPRYRDRVTGEWKDGSTSFANVECWRNLASNVKASLSKGNPVVVTGRLRVREFEDREGRRRISVEIDADSIGHDLSSGVTHLLPSLRRADGADAVDGAVAGAGAVAGEQPDGLAAGEAIRSGHDAGQPDGDGVPVSAEVFDADAVASLAGETAEPVAAAAPF